MRLAVSGLGKVLPTQSILHALNADSNRHTTHAMIGEYASILCKDRDGVTLDVLTEYVCRHPVLSSWFLFLSDIPTPHTNRPPINTPSRIGQ